MMTQTHSLIAVALLAHPQRPIKQNVAILIGSLIPDVAIFCLFIWAQFQGVSGQELWQDIYFSEPMLTFTAIGNSLPLYGFLLLVFVSIAILRSKHTTLPTNSLTTKNNLWTYISGSTMALFALAAITHLLGDFPVHASDAHPHFWPFSNWRFESPVSYWDDKHHGQIYSFFEAILGVLLSVIVFRRFKNVFVRILTGLAILFYIVVPIYFSLTL